MNAYTALDIAGGLFGPPLLAALASIPVSWRSRRWFACWWLLAAGWLCLACALVPDSAGALSAAASFVAGSAAYWWPGRGQ